MSRTNRSGRTKATGYQFVGRITDDAHLRALLERALRDRVVTEFDYTISADPWRSGVWFNGHAGKELRQIRNAVRGLIERAK